MRRAVFLVVVIGAASLWSVRLHSQVSPADGPWAGWAQCQLTARFSGPGENYLNEQMHTWVLTGTSPVSGTAIKVYAATWTVTGQGNRQRTLADGRTVAEQWTTAGQAMPDTLSVRLAADGILHIGGAAQLRSQNATTGTSVTHSTSGTAPDQTTPIGYYVDEFTFPMVQDVATKTTISGSTGTAPLMANVAPGQPAGTQATSACSWQFVRGATTAVLPPPPTGTSTAAATATAAPKVTLSAAGSGGTIQTASTGTTSGTTSKDTTLRQEALASGPRSSLPTLMSTASTDGLTGMSMTSSDGGMTATIKGPKNLTAGMKATFNLTLTSAVTSPNATQVVVSSATFTFDSNEGETSVVSLPSQASSGMLSATFTFQTTGTYLVSARGTAARTTAVQVQTPIYSTPSCLATPCPPPVFTGFTTETRYVTDQYQFSLQEQLVVSAP